MEKSIVDQIKNSIYKLAILVSAFTMLASCGGNSSTSSISNETTSIETSSIETTSLPIAIKNNYSNPTYPLLNGVKKPTYMADPFILQDNNDLYLYCTQTDVFLQNGTKSFVRGPIYTCKDGVNWVYCGNVFDDYVPNWGEKDAGVWAPTVCKIQNKYVYYYALSIGNDTNPGIGYAYSNSPTGPWTHKGKLFNSSEIGVTNSIDPFVFVDNNKVYMVFGSFGGLITLIELESDGLSLKNGIDYQNTNKVALAGYDTFNMDNYEASIIFKRNGYYYLMLSTGSCCSGAKSTYHIVVAKSEKIEGPYLDGNGKGMFAPKRGSYVVTPEMSGAMGVGHNGLFMDDNNEYWMVYHGYDTTDSSMSSSRVTYLDKLLFDENEMPYVENYHASNHVTLAGPYFKLIEGTI